VLMFEDQCMLFLPIPGDPHHRCCRPVLYPGRHWQQPEQVFTQGLLTSMLHFISTYCC
jgi:hypothetical protein